MKVLRRKSRDHNLSSISKGENCGECLLFGATPRSPGVAAFAPLRYNRTPEALAHFEKAEIEKINATISVANIRTK